MKSLEQLFADGPLTYEQLIGKATEAGVKLVDLSSGGYVSKDRYDSKVATLGQQITDLQGQLGTRDADLAGLREQLTAAQGDAAKLAEVQAQFTSLQGKYEQDTTAFQQRLDKQAHSFAIRESASTLRFSSEAAKRQFLSEADNKGFQLENGKPLGWDDYVANYKANDPGAFAAETKDNAGDPLPQVVLPSGSGKSGAGTSSNVFNFGFTGVRPHPSNS